VLLVVGGGLAFAFAFEAGGAVAPSVTMMGLASGEGWTALEDQKEEVVEAGSRRRNANAVFIENI
jgi:hypothetical protein